jgi:quercetin dioxygenase-like cupin family protein
LQNVSAHIGKDLIVAAAASLATLSVVAVAQERPNFVGPSVWEWNALPARATDVGAYRQIVRGPTATLDELEMHVTTLNPGLASHEPHRHPNEELVIIREGQVEVLNGGRWQRAGPGSIIFNASNDLHALRNVGTTPATYHVINWRTPATPRS